MELPQNYFDDLGRAALRFAGVTALLTALYFALRAHLKRDRLARAFRWSLLALIYVIVSAVVLNAFMTRWGFRGDASNHGFVQMLEHEAHRPFSYRVLSPAIVNAGAALVPGQLRARWQPWLLEKSPLLRYRAPYESWNPDKALKWHVAYGYLFACLLAALFAARALTRTSISASPLFADYAPALALLLLPLTFLRGGYFYDFPELAFLFGCTLFAAKGRWTAFAILYPLAILNKESNILLVVTFLAFAASRLPRRRLLIHAGSQFAVGVLLVATVRFVFRDAGGGAAQPWFPLNVLFFLSPEWYAKFFTPFAPLIPIPRGINVFSLALLAFMVAWRWPAKPTPLRRLLLANAAITLPLYLLFGFLDEIRALSLLFPALFLHGCWALNDVYRENEPKTQTAER
ncbi:MAG: hypothetical protein JRG80_14870 [Deltaproteobacteria bacterium]|nr:hypothetical protein [Deltaproteobacteria bacterium]MBW2666442.1 hypothetical protein [Deltaproteobacteria bacterium]